MRTNLLILGAALVSFPLYASTPIARTSNNSNSAALVPAVSQEDFVDSHGDLYSIVGVGAKYTLVEVLPVSATKKKLLVEDANDTQAGAVAALKANGYTVPKSIK